MAKLVYITNMSLDGYIEDKDGNFDWANPEEVFEFITDLIRPIGTCLCGRRIYETMAHWDAPLETYPPGQRDFATLWQNLTKIVFSRTLTQTPAGYARVDRSFNAELIRRLKRECAHDIAIAGAELAGLALEANLIDECHLFLHPVVVGGGKPALQVASRRNLELLETRTFSTGVTYAHYRTQTAARNKNGAPH